MSEHEWCRDTARDEAVRAAEDAVANWRLLEVGEVAKAGDEQLVNGKWCALVNGGYILKESYFPHRRRRAPAIQHRDLPDEVALLRASLTDILGRVVRIEGEIDAGKVEAVEAVPPPDPASPGEGMRTERVTLEVTHRYHQPLASWLLGALDSVLNGPGENVFVMDGSCEIARLTAQRDAAHAEAERLRARVAELEAASAVPSWPLGWLTAEERDSVDHAADIIEDMEDADGNSLKKKADALRAILARPSSEPRGWLTAEERSLVESLRETFQQNADGLRSAGSVGHAENWERRVRILDGILARPSSEPRGWLTAEERQAVADAATTLHELSHFRLSWALHSLLARETPPRVRRPPRACTPHRDAEWIAAIREAGGEVEVENE